MGVQRRPHALAALSTLLGPVTAGLYETDRLPSLGADLGGVWFVTAAGLVGLAVAAYGIRQRTLVLGAVSMIVNAGVTALYGFLAVFFTFGGSR